MMVLVCLTFAYVQFSSLLCPRDQYFSKKNVQKNVFMHISDNIYLVYKWACLSCESIDLCRCDTEVDFCLFVSHFCIFYFFWNPEWYLI